MNVLEYTLPYELPMPGAPAPLQLNATFYVYLPPPDYDYGADGRRGLRPLLFLLHGFNVAPESYSALLGELTARGYVVVAPDFVQALNIPIPGMPRECGGDLGGVFQERTRCHCAATMAVVV